MKRVLIAINPDPGGVLCGECSGLPSDSPTGKEYCPWSDLGSPANDWQRERGPFCVDAGAVACSQCAKQEGDGTLDDFTRDRKRARASGADSLHACPHAWWDDEYGTWREAEDDAPACLAFERKP